MYLWVTDLFYIWLYESVVTILWRLFFFAVVYSEPNARRLSPAFVSERRRNGAAEAGDRSDRDGKRQGDDVARHAAARLERSLVHLLQTHQERVREVKASRRATDV